MRGLLLLFVLLLQMAMAIVVPNSRTLAPWQMPEAGRRALWALMGYTPWPEQELAHLDGSRIRLLAGGERAGKSLWTAMEKVGWVFVAPSGGLFWIVGPSYELAQPEFKHLVPALATLGLLDARQLSVPRYGSCRLVTRSGVTVQTRSGRDPETLAGQAPDGIAMVEAAQQTYDVFLRLLGRCAEKNAPLILSGTFEGSLGWYPELWKRWQADNLDDAASFSMPTWSNLTVYPGGRDDPKIKALEATFPEDAFQERFGAIPCPPATLVFKEFEYTTHVKHCPFDKKLPVRLWIDPGYAHHYAVQAVQIEYGGDVLHIDEIWRTGLVTSEMIQIARRREWWDKVRFAVMCFGGTQHQAMPSPQEVWQQEAGIPVFAEPVPIPDGIERHRTYLINPATGKPRMFYDPKCKGSIWEYGRYKYHAIVEGRPVRENPIDADNDCVIGDTLIDMPGGKHKIADLVGQEPYVYCCIDGDVKVRRAFDIRKAIEGAPIYCLLMDRGELYVTGDHLVMLANGTYQEAARLKPGQSLMALNRYVNLEGYTRVCMTGQTRRTQSEHRLVYKEVYGEIPAGYHIDHIDEQRWNNAPENLRALSIEEHNARHHAGKVIAESQRRKLGEASRRSWAEDDGTRLAVVRQNVKSAHEANRGREVTDETRAALSEAGKRAWQGATERRERQAERQRGQEHTVAAKEKVRVAKLAWWHSPEGQRAKERLAKQRMENGRFGENHRVIAVYPVGRADVYDMSVEEAHNFVAEGVVIHNCLKATAYGLVHAFGFVRKRPIRDVQIRFRTRRGDRAGVPTREGWGR